MLFRSIKRAVGSRMLIPTGTPLDSNRFRGLLKSLHSILSTITSHPFKFQDSLPSPLFKFSHPTNYKTSNINILRRCTTLHSYITTPISHTPTAKPTPPTNQSPLFPKSQRATTFTPTAALQDSASRHHQTKHPGSTHLAATRNLLLPLPRKIRHVSHRRRLRSQLPHALHPADITPT